MKKNCGHLLDKIPPDTEYAISLTPNHILVVYKGVLEIYVTPEGATARALNGMELCREDVGGPLTVNALLRLEEASKKLGDALLKAVTEKHV